MKVLRSISGEAADIPAHGSAEMPVWGTVFRSVSADERVSDMRVYNLIRDLTADSLGGWNLVVALQAGGGLTAQRFMMNRTYDIAGARAAALKAAGAA